MHIFLDISTFLIYIIYTVIGNPQFHMNRILINNKQEIHLNKLRILFLIIHNNLSKFLGRYL